LQAGASSLPGSRGKSVGGVVGYGIITPTLVDTGAWLSYITLSLAIKIEKEFGGIRGKGRYKVIDAFQKAHYFFDDISFRVSLSTGDSEVDNKSWLIKAVVVNIDFAADFLLGLRDIKRIKLFKYIPDLVESEGMSDDEKGVVEELTDIDDNVGSSITGLGSIEWSSEERRQRAIDAYEKEEIKEVDYSLVEAIPSEAFEEEEVIKIPEGIFGP
jgi:hypothetical protein